jgi:predicted transcriptional regulator of viral defense system
VIIKLDNLKKKFYENDGYLTTAQIMKVGYKKWWIRNLIDDGIIERVKRGLYKLRDDKYFLLDEEVDIIKMVPMGVICLASALSFHELTTYTPYEYQLAIDRRYKVIVPEYPPIKVYYYDTKYYEMGMQEVLKEGHVIRVYNMEKTLCDCLRYRNKLSNDIIIEAFKEYMKRKDKNLTLLMEYAKECRVSKIIKIYMEVLI